MTFNLFSRLIFWLKKIFYIRPKAEFDGEKPPIEVLPERKIIETTQPLEEKSAKIIPAEEKPREVSSAEEKPEKVPLSVEETIKAVPLPEEKPPKIPPKEGPVESKSPEEKTPEVLPEENPTIEFPRELEEEAKTKIRKPYKRKAPTKEREKESGEPPEDEKKPAVPKQRKEIDLGARYAKRTKTGKPPQPNEKDKVFKEKEVTTRIESPFVEIDLDEAKIFLILPSQLFIPDMADGIPQQLSYELQLNSEKQKITVKVTVNHQGFALIQEKRIELGKLLKNFQIVFPDELQGKRYSYNHNNENLYAFVAIGNNRGRMYYLYDKDGNINSLPNRMAWLLLHENFKLEIDSNYLTEETWIWEKYRPFRVNLKEMNELVIKNTKTSKEYKLSCELTFSVDGQVIEDDFKDQMPLLIGETLKIKAPRENPYGWTVWIQNKVAGYRIITENWSGVEPLSLKLPDDLPCECGELQVDICQQQTRIPDETLFFRWLPFIELDYPKKLLIPKLHHGHKAEIIKITLDEVQEWELKTKTEFREDGFYQIKLPPEKDTFRFSIAQRDKPETEIRIQVTIPRLKWKTSKHEAWNGKLQNIKRDELIYGESFYLLICTNDINNKYDLSAILETSGQKLQEGKFIQQGINYNLELNQFYDTIKRNKKALILNVEIRKAKDHELLGTPKILYFDADQIIQIPSSPKPVSYDLINAFSLPKICYVLRRIKATHRKEKSASKKMLQFYYQKIRSGKKAKRDTNMYKRTFMIQSLAFMKFIMDTYGDKIPIKGQKKWRRKIDLLQQEYQEEFSNAFDSFSRRR